MIPPARVIWPSINLPCTAPGRASSPDKPAPKRVANARKYVGEPCPNFISTYITQSETAGTDLRIDAMPLHLRALSYS